MSWKNWPSWLKGGLIGIVVGIVMFFIMRIEFMENNDPNPYFFGLFGFPTIFLLFIIEETIIDIVPESLGTIIFPAAILIINYFIIGAVIGLIIGRIKSKKAKK